MRREGQGRGHEAVQAGGTRCRLQTNGGTPSLVSTATEAQAPRLLMEEREKHDSKMYHWVSHLINTQYRYLQNLQCISFKNECAIPKPSYAHWHWILGLKQVLLKTWSNKPSMRKLTWTLKLSGGNEPHCETEGGKWRMAAGLSLIWCVLGTGVYVHLCTYTRPELRTFRSQSMGDYLYLCSAQTGLCSLPSLIP